MILRLIIVVAVIVVIVVLLYPRPRRVFRMRIVNGKPVVDFGNVPLMFVQDAQDIVARSGIFHATVTGVQSGRHVKLQFSSSVPEHCRQRLRNTWVLYGHAKKPDDR